MREARAMAAIEHENVVRVLDFGETHEGALFIVMEYLDGEELVTTLERDGPMPWPRVKNILLQICRGLAAAHEQGTVHRDVKTDNIVRLTRSDNIDAIKVIDFGIARSVDGSDYDRLTRTGAVIGTPEYMAPERAKSNTVDYRADIYSVGVIGYELLTGQVPIKGVDFMETLWKHAHEVALMPSLIVPGLALEADGILLKALAKEPNERYQSMSEMVKVLEGTLPTPSVPPSSISPLFVSSQSLSGQSISERILSAREASARSISSQAALSASADRVSRSSSGVGTSTKAPAPKQPAKSHPVILGVAVGVITMMLLGVSWWLLSPGGSDAVASQADGTYNDLKHADSGDKGRVLVAKVPSAAGSTVAVGAEAEAAEANVAASGEDF